jgi:hypothetical protein
MDGKLTSKNEGKNGCICNRIPYALHFERVLPYIPSLIPLNGSF